MPLVTNPKQILLDMHKRYSTLYWSYNQIKKKKIHSTKGYGINKLLPTHISKHLYFFYTLKTVQGKNKHFVKAKMFFKKKFIGKDTDV